jgi:hypothetical protein
VSDEAQHRTLRIPRRRGASLPLWLLVVGATFGAGCSKSTPPSDQVTEQQPATPVASAPVEKKAKKKKANPPKPVQPPGTFRVDFGSRPTADTVVEGWTRVTDQGRRIARLSAPKGTVTFDLTPVAPEYVLTGVARVEGAKAAKLTPTLNGKSLSAWSLTSDWSMFSSPVPKDALGATKDELALAPSALKPPAELSFDALAIVPVSDRASVQIGAETSGLLIDGFYNLERGWLRWSRGNRSLWGAVLKPSGAPYRLTVRAACSSHVMPLSVTARVNGRDVGAAEFSSKMRDVTWNVPSGALTSGINRVELSYPKTVKPNEFGRSKDARDIAIRIARLDLAPAG